MSVVKLFYNFLLSNFFKFMSLFILNFFLFFSFSTYAEEATTDSTVSPEQKVLEDVAEDVPTQADSGEVTQDLESDKDEEVAPNSQIAESANEDSDPSSSEGEETVSNSQIVKDSDQTSDAGNVDILLEIKSLVPSYKYNPSDKENPFTPPGQVGEQDLETPEKDRLHPVEEDEWDNIELKAIIWGKDEQVIPRALFQTSDKKTYTLTKNDRIGKERSLIFRIDSNKVWAMKPFIDPGTGVVGYEPHEKKLDSEKKDGNLYYER